MVFEVLSPKIGYPLCPFLELWYWCDPWIGFLFLYSIKLQYVNNGYDG